MSGNAFDISNQAAVNAARIGFEAAFFHQLQLVADDPVSQLFTTKTTTKPQQLITWLGDLPSFRQWAGDRDLVDMSALKQLVAVRPWQAGLRVHQDNLDDDNLGLFPEAVGTMAENCKHHRCDLMVQLLLNGFDGLQFPDAGRGLAFDNAFFFSSSHSVGGGPAQSNYLGAIPLTKQNLELAEVRLNALRTYDGKQPLNIRGTHLIVGPALFAQAKLLVEAQLIASNAGTATESNIHFGQYKIIMSPRISGAQANYWFLADLSRVMKPAFLLMRREITPSSLVGTPGQGTDTVPRFQRGELWFGVEARYEAALFAWQLVVGANPPAP
jgi:phage major head subunit gpT-like protein